DVRICTPESLWPSQEVSALAKKYNEQVMITSTVAYAVASADVIYTDVWVPMGEAEKFAERVELLKPYQVNMKMIKETGNEYVIFLHC
ncbi:ornithine carbamoyltransferase, partial [Bacillus tropicus]|nr:ornithine carbamoyltransferase [Bacillus tropicus]